MINMIDEGVVMNGQGTETWDEKKDVLSERIIGCAMEVHRRLGPGYLESVYEKALVIELMVQGISCRSQVALPVSYRDQPVGDFIADVVVADTVILELKACYLLHARHETQLVNYLVATGLDVGLLINFGSNSLQFKRKYRVFRHAPQSC